MKVWQAAQSVKINFDNVTPGFDIGFDSSIDEQTKNKYRAFVEWIESNYNIPITLWVDFEDKNYLVGRDKKRKGFLFYWKDPCKNLDFSSQDDIPSIRLPISEKNWSFRSIIGSFIEAISEYYAWLQDFDMESFKPDEDEIDAILVQYFDK